MSTAKHTPGPWVARGKYVFADRDCIGICDTDNASDGRMEANARLIAAAPEMYEALESLIGAAEALGHPEYGALLKARAALAKAEARHD